ncbi:MAG: SRPBCC family protein [Actinomycetota bacterium]
MNKPSQRKLLIGVDLPVPADRAWAALKQPEQIREWFGYYGADYSSWGIGTMRTLDDEIAVVFGREARYENFSRRITWEGGDEFLLTPKGERCLLEVFMVRPAPLKEVDWRKVYDPICEGWIAFTQQLRFYLDRHTEGQRSTIFFTGLPAADAFGILKLQSMAEVEPGAKYGILTPMGDHLTGELWYKTFYQIGLTVDLFGDGLLIVSATPPTEQLPGGGADLTLTTFLGPEEQDGLQQRWSGTFSEAIAAPS